MSKLYIFAIGGSGSRVLRSFTMLLASGQDVMKGYDVYPVILDYDTTNGDTKIAKQCIENYSNINRIAWKDTKIHDAERGEKGDGGYFLSKLFPLGGGDGAKMDSFQMVYAPKGQNKFCDYIGYEGLKSNTKNTRMLLDALYNNEETNDQSELYLDMVKGFKGNPNIGCMVFHNIETEAKEFRDFLQNLNNNDKVVVIGSLFGGTGSSGIPEVIKKIRTQSNNGAKVPIASIFVMPYFVVDDIPNAAVKSKLFYSKTKAAINYYHDSGLITTTGNGKTTASSSINSAYFIGDPDPLQLPYRDGGEEQINPANPVEFISALSILHFVNQKPADYGCFKFGSNQFIYGKNGIGKSNLIYKDLYNDAEATDFVKPVIRRLTAFTVAMKYFMFKITNPDKRLKKAQFFGLLNLANPSTDTENLFENLKKFWEKYKLWLDELATKQQKVIKDGQIKTIQIEGGHTLSLFNTGDDKDAFNILYTSTDAGNGKKRDQNKSVDPDDITAAADDAIDKWRKKGQNDFNVNDLEFLFIHGLFMASNDAEDVITPLFS